MGNETSKSIPRRLRDPAFLQRYFVGRGIDVGSGGDPLGKYRPLFPQMVACDEWDLPQGDATLLQGVPDGHYYFVHSSHCLEHLADPEAALTNWLRVVKPGGHVIVIVPDWELYERGNWPSLYNSDHKHWFTMANSIPVGSAGNAGIYVPDLLDIRGTLLVKLERLESTFLPDVEGDQTVGIGECGIEFVLRRL